MSYAICNVQKYSSSHDISGMQIHDMRERDHSNSNPDIDFNRSSLNYNLCNNLNGMSFNEYINKQIAERYTGKKAVRKDAVRMVKVLFTSDSEFFERLTAEQQQEYFQSCYDWAAERWGSNNIISAAVHLDEKTPHLHLNFVPLTADGRLSAKECIGNGSIALQKLQDDFYQTVGKRFGLERGSRADLENGERPRRRQRVAEFKESTNYYQQQKNSLENEVQDLQQQKNALENEVQDLQQQKNALESDTQALQATVNKYNDILHAELQNAIESVPVPSMAKLAVGKDNKDKVLVSPSDLEQLQELAKAVAVTAAANDKHSSELAQKAAEQEKIQSELTERERIVSRKEKNTAELRSSAERMLSEAEEKRVFYETSDPMVQRLQQRLNGIMAENNELVRDLRQERKEKSSLKEHNTALQKQLSDQQEQIQPLQQQNGELSERVRVLEEELVQKNAEIQKISEDKQRIGSLYDTTFECAEYVCNKVGMDFDRILDMRIQGYRLSYIVDEGRGRSR